MTAGQLAQRQDLLAWVERELRSAGKAASADDVRLIARGMAVAVALLSSGSAEPLPPPPVHAELRAPSRAGERWTEQEDAVLREMRGRGEGFDAIASTLRRAAASCQTRASELRRTGRWGLPRVPPGPRAKPPAAEPFKLDNPPETYARMRPQAAPL